MKHPSINASQQNLFEIKPEKIQKGKSTDEYVFDLVDALQAPILTFSTQWADSIPKRLIDNVAIARLKALMFDEQMATLIESVIYIYTRTYEAPMDSDWTEIYLHISCKTLQEYFGEDHWKVVGAANTLSEWLQSKLDDIRRHIYKKRRQILKQNLKQTEPDEKPEKDNKKVKPTLQKPPELFSDLYNF